MADHRFKIGQMVFFHPRSRNVDVPRGRPFQITQRLPVTDGEPQYRIRGTHFEHEVAASESELRPVQASSATRY
jgi:hypothetical protein